MYFYAITVVCVYAIFYLFIAAKNDAFGTTYIRWGRSECPKASGASIVYSGLIVGAWYENPGGLGYTCFPLDPEPEYVYTDTVECRTWIHSTEYSTSGAVFPGINYDAPCVVCFVPRVTSLMIPAQLLVQMVGPLNTQDI